MAQPFNYNIQSPNLTGSVLGGLQQGLGLSDAFRARALQQEQLAERKRMDEERRNLSARIFQEGGSPDIQDYIRLVEVTQDPKLREAYQKQFESLSAEARNDQAEIATQVLYSIDSGNPQRAVDLINERAEQHEAAGDTRTADMLYRMAEATASDPNFGKSLAIPMLTSSKEGRDSLKAYLERRKSEAELAGEKDVVNLGALSAARRVATGEDGTFDVNKAYEELQKSGANKATREEFYKMVDDLKKREPGVVVQNYPKAFEKLQTKRGEKLADDYSDMVNFTNTGIPNALKMKELLKAVPVDNEGRVITGAFARLGLGARNVISAITGIQDPDVSATQEFLARVVTETANTIRDFGAGTGLSDADREFATRLAAGDISMTREALENIVDISLDKATRNIKAHNRDVDKFFKGEKGIDNLRDSIKILHTDITDPDVKSLLFGIKEGEEIPTFTGRVTDDELRQFLNQ